MPGAIAEMDEHPVIINKDSARILSTAVAAAYWAGEIQKNHFENVSQPSEVLLHDVKLEVDVLCEQAITKTILGIFPDHAIFGEEGGMKEGSSPYTWILDPLDGTVNYFHGIPHFCVSIACFDCHYSELPLRGPEIMDAGLAGIIYAPIAGEIYIALRGEGAVLNGRNITCSRARKLEDVIIGMSFGKTEDDMTRMARLCQECTRRARKVRSYGSACLDLAFVARGRLGGLIYRGIHLWDIAAGGIILKEAGGVINAEKHQEGDLWDFTAAAPGIGDQLFKLASESG